MPKKLNATRLETRRHCPNAGCGSSKIVCNGSYKRKYGGMVKRFLCRVCGHAWKEIEKPDANHSDDVTLQAFALVAMGLPLNNTEVLTGRKSETIRSRLL